MKQTRGKRARQEDVDIDMDKKHARQADVEIAYRQGGKRGIGREKERQRYLKMNRKKNKQTNKTRIQKEKIRPTHKHTDKELNCMTESMALGEGRIEETQ